VAWLREFAAEHIWGERFPRLLVIADRLASLLAERERLRGACRVAVPCLYWATTHGGQCDEVIEQLQDVLVAPEQEPTRCQP
jgi:hypothetical protein